MIFQVFTVTELSKRVILKIPGHSILSHSFLQTSGNPFVCAFVSVCVCVCPPRTPPFPADANNARC